MKTVKINREFIDMFYFCPQYAYMYFFGQKQITDINDKILKFNKLSNFTDEFYIFKMYSKILTYIFFIHNSTGKINYDNIINFVSEMLKEEKEKEQRYERYEKEILQNVKKIIDMFDPKDSITIKYKTIKDKFELNEHIENYFVKSQEYEYEKYLLNKDIKYKYEIEIPFIITENNSSQSCVPIIFSNKEIEKCPNVYDINSLMSLIYIKSNSFYNIFNKVIFYDFKNFKRIEVEIDYKRISKTRELIRILSQIILKNFVRNIDQQKCTQCNNLEFCKNYNIYKKVKK